MLVRLDHQPHTLDIISNSEEKNAASAWSRSSVGRLWRKVLGSRAESTTSKLPEAQSQLETKLEFNKNVRSGGGGGGSDSGGGKGKVGRWLSGLETGAPTMTTLSETQSQLSRNMKTEKGRRIDASGGGSGGKVRLGRRIDGDRSSTTKSTHTQTHTSGDQKEYVWMLEIMSEAYNKTMQSLGADKSPETPSAAESCRSVVSDDPPPPYPGSKHSSAGSTSFGSTIARDLASFASDNSFGFPAKGHREPGLILYNRSEDSRQTLLCHLSRVREEPKGQGELKLPTVWGWRKYWDSPPPGHTRGEAEDRQEVREAWTRLRDSVKADSGLRERLVDGLSSMFERGIRSLFEDRDQSEVLISTLVPISDSKTAAGR